MRKKRRKLKPQAILLLIVIILVIIIIVGSLFLKPKDNNNSNSTSADKMVEIKTITEANFLANQYSLDLNITYEYSDTIAKDSIISQSISVGTPIEIGQKLDVVVSLGKIDKEKLASDNINELGTVPIMMYHGIVDKPSSETGNTGGNVDKDGYNRTAEAFREDLEFYYQNDYRMVRLIDYVNGKIDVEYKKSPVILTFDDGNENNLKVTGLDSEGNIIIDENCAVGILESFKKKYPDFKVTATFFVNSTLFNQSEYDEKIITWLVENGYDVGNHTENHLDIKASSSDKVQKEIVSVYNQLEEIIPGKYVNIIALPFGSPYSKEHSNFKYVLNSTYENKTYDTIAALRVGWEPEVSPFNKNFDKTFLKRVRAYDNNGKEFDIKMSFDMLKTKRYISDGNVDTIVTSEANSSLIGDTTLEVIYY